MGPISNIDIAQRVALISDDGMEEKIGTGGAEKNIRSCRRVVMCNSNAQSLLRRDAFLTSLPRHLLHEVSQSDLYAVYA